MNPQQTTTFKGQTMTPPDVTTVSTLGEWLSLTMQSTNYTRQKLADDLEVSKAAVDKWLANKSKPRVEHLIAICTLCYPGLDTWQQYMYATAISCSISLGTVPYVDTSTSGHDTRRT